MACGPGLGAALVLPAGAFGLRDAGQAVLFWRLSAGLSIIKKKKTGKKKYFSF
jgi:hypothetical protein